MKKDIQMWIILKAAPLFNLYLQGKKSAEKLSSLKLDPI